jgi:ERCC4-type nuclease
MVDLVVDVRERDLIDLLKKQEFEHKVESLQIGDVLFRKDGEIVFLIERKTLADLRASIHDKRLREQKARMLGSVRRNRVAYVIEGNYGKSTETNVKGAVINIEIRDEIKCHKTCSLNETAEYIKMVHKKLCDDVKIYFSTNNELKTVTSSEYSSVLKTEKKANMTPEVWFITVLSTIPQVSTKISTSIAERYKTMDNMVKEYEKIESEKDRKKLISDITYSVKGDKTRRVGEKVSERVYSYVYGV